MLTEMRPSRRAFLSPFLALAFVLALGSSAVAPAPAEAATYRLNLYRSGDFVAQTNLVQCVGASMQMMINMMAAKNNRTAAFQLDLQVLAREYSNRYGTTPNLNRRGASVRGWAAGLNDMGYGPYLVVGFDSIDAAMRAAAHAIAFTGRPVGLLVWRGRHAWVMNGFQATADPKRTASFKVTHALVMDPLYPRVSPTWGRSPAPNTRLTVAQLGQDFVKRRTNSNTNPNDPITNPVNPFAAYQTSLSGKWVLVLPVDPPAQARPAGLRAA